MARVNGKVNANNFKEVIFGKGIKETVLRTGNLGKCRGK
jgi:hypothetical protein